MPESPCADCGEKTVVHTEDDYRPLCDDCQEYENWMQVLKDIIAGRLTVPPQEEEPA